MGWYRQLQQRGLQWYLLHACAGGFSRRDQKSDSGEVDTMKNKLAHSVVVLLAVSIGCSSGGGGGNGGGITGGVISIDSDFWDYYF